MHLSRYFGMSLLRSLLMVAGLAPLSLPAQTIDFESIGTITGPPFDVVQQGFRVQQIVTQGYPEPIIASPPQSPNNSDVYAICGFCGGGAPTGFNLFAEDGAPFNLVSIDLGGFGNLADEFDFTLTGYTAGGTELIATLTVPAESIQTLALGPEWANLINVSVIVDNAGNAGFSGSAYDNIVIGRFPVVVNVGTTPPAVTLHPHHDGGPGVVAGLNDVIPVIVYGSSTAVGDPVDLTANTIDPTSLRFGPAAGPVAPGSTPEFAADYDGDGLLDARFEFLTGDTGIGCADSAATLTGRAAGGESFIGMDDITTDCNAGCHN